MSCPHAETTTLLWVYGEGPEAHLHHVASCAVCQEVVAEHEAVAAAVMPVLPVIPKVEVANDNRAWLRWAGLLAIAAVGLVAVRVATLPPTEAPDTPVATVVDASPAVVFDPPFDNELDNGLDDLDALVDALSADLSTL